MTLTIDRTELQLTDGTQLTLVSEHQRALPGEAGSNYKPVAVREHLRRIDETTGKENSYKTSWKWQRGEISSELIEAMADVVKLPRTSLPTKDWSWTLKQATYVLNKGMRYDRKNNVWYRSVGCWVKSIDECMAKMDRKDAKKAALALTR